jgi:hypothetical protein
MITNRKITGVVKTNAKIHVCDASTTSPSAFSSFLTESLQPSASSFRGDLSTKASLEKRGFNYVTRHAGLTCSQYRRNMDLAKRWQERQMKIFKRGDYSMTRWMWAGVATLFLYTAPAFAASQPVAWDTVTTNADGTAITDLAGYRIFHSTVDFRRSGVYISTTQAMSDTRIQKTTVGPTSTGFTITTLLKDSTYYFRLTAYDTAGNQSGFNVDTAGADTELVKYIPRNCDVNDDNTVNGGDVQVAINQVLGVTPCTGGVDPNKLCDGGDIQRVINAILGLGCNVN